MTIRPLVFGAALLLAACGDSDSGGDTEGAGAGAGAGSGGGFSSGGGEDPLVGGVADEETTTGSGLGGHSPGGTGGGSDGGGDAVGMRASDAEPDPFQVCPGCCTGAPNLGQEELSLRVGDSNSFASPLLVEALLPDWNGVSPLPVRKDDFLNLFAPEVAAIDGDPRAFDAAASPFPSPSGETLLTLQIAYRDLTPIDGVRSIGVLVDTSPSAATSVESVLGALQGVVVGLRPDDAIGVFSVYDGPEARVIRPFATVQETPIDEEALVDAVNRELEATGDRVQVSEALLDALSQVKEDARGRGLAQASLVVVSDGRTEVSPEALTAVSAAAGSEELPVRVVGVGVGAARSFSDEALDKLTSAGGGAYVYFDGSAGAQSFLAGRVDELFSIAHRSVRLELALPQGLELVRLEGGGVTSEPKETEEVVRGQTLAAGGTMTFHHLLRWTGEGPIEACDAIGWAVKSEGPVGDDTLAQGTVVMGNAFAGVLDSVARRQGSAVVAAATAFQGPTQGRLTGAVESLLSARLAMEANGSTWQDHPLSRLCGAVTLACSRRGFDCGTCDSVDQP